MKFCNACGGPVSRAIPPGEDRERWVCPACGAIHYENPKMVVGCIPEWEDRILLCRRAIEPRAGLWTVPAGFLETGESVLEAAGRETLEEGGAAVEILGLYAVFSLVQIGQVYLMTRGRLLATVFRPGHESLEARLFREEEVPWRDLAFPVIRETLAFYFADRLTGRFPLRIGDILPAPGTPPGYRATLWSPPES